MSFTKEIVFRPAWDKRHSDPTQDYGVHGVDMVFYLTEEKGVIQFVVYTNWNLPSVTPKHDRLIPKPFPADLGYHSHTPHYDGHTICRDTCELLGGKPCYYDGSSLNAEPVFQLLVSGGSQAVWENLIDYYHQVFDT